MDVAHADFFVRRGHDGVAMTRGRTRVAFQRRFQLADPVQAQIENDIRLEERRRERARMVHEFHDTLLQGFLGASMLLDEVVEQMPADSPSKPALSRALCLVRRAIEEGRAAIRGIHTGSLAASSLEHAFSKLLEEVTPCRGIQVRLLVQGRTPALNPAIREQLFLIGREAVMNSFRHSHATKIDVEVEYMRGFVRVLVRDNGCGIETDALQKSGDWHWGLRGMCERAEDIGAQFHVRSSPGAGTEVSVAVPVNVTK
jgi:signal transduction histidine kinase